MKKSSLAKPNLRLKEVRELRGWSQKYVADGIGAERYYLSRWEHGAASPSPYYRQKLCILFGMNARELGLLPEDHADELESQVEQLAATPVQVAPVSAESASRVFDPTLPTPLMGAARLVGRDEIVQQLRQRLCTGKGVVLTAINGLPGVGKTTLAVELAHDEQIQEHFQHGVLWAGLGPTPDVFAILSHWGTLLGIPPLQMIKLSSIDEWSRALRTAIGQRRLLLVIDDAWRIEAALAFKVGGPHCAYLVTTRFPNIALHFTYEAGEAIVLKELSIDEGLALLARLAPEVVRSEPQSARALVQAVGGLPLALTLMGKYLRVQEHGNQPRRIRAALERLRTANERLRLTEPLSPLERPVGLDPSAPLSLQTVIAVSDQHLEDQEQHALRALSIFPAKPNSFSEEAAQAVSAVPVETLDALSDAGLLENSSPGRYTLHQTITDYAQVQLTDPSVYERMANFFAAFVEQHEKDFDLLDIESNNIFAALDVAYTAGNRRSYLRCINAFFLFLFTRSLHNEETGTYLEKALPMARQENDTILLAMTLLARGKLIYRQGNYAQAEADLLEAHELVKPAGNAKLLSEALMMLGILARFHVSYDRAEAYFSQSLELARRVNDPELVSDVLSRLGGMFSDRGRYAEAEAYNQEGLELARAVGNTNRVAKLVSNLSTLAILQGKFEQAERYGLEALELARQVGSLDEICYISTNLGALALDMQEYTKAERYLKESLAIARRIADMKIISADLGSLGTLAMRLERYDEASAYLQESLALARQVGDTWLVSSILNERGELALKQQHLEEASAAFSEASSISAQGNQSEVAAALFGLARVAAERGDIVQARRLGRECLDILQPTGNRWNEAVQAWYDALPGEA
ncbi:MAG TPA: tetratricopeptide repeat protein [Ktedonobacteraceae bacterium]|nr:tetratricopeptide repeat protein [Ktedonobacteraceae bacterium]